MEEGYKILAVDDESINREILLSSLEGHYSIRCVADGQACLVLLDDWEPDLILMDVNMPGMNGLETCKLIKTNPQLAELPIIFISGLSSPDERLAGYKVGGIDYISKPFVPNELIAKINIALSHKHKIKVEREKTQLVKLTARTAMDAAVENSFVLQFLQKCLSCDSLTELYQHFFQSISEYNLRGVAEFSTRGEQFIQSNSGDANPLEVGLLHKMADKSGVFRFGKRAIYNRKHLSLLLLDLPTEDEYKCDRLLDHIEMIVDAASSAIGKLLNQASVQEQLDRLHLLAASTVDSLKQLQTLQQDTKSDHQEMVDSLWQQIGSTLADFNPASENEQQTSFESGAV